MKVSVFLWLPLSVIGVIPTLIPRLELPSVVSGNIGENRKTKEGVITFTTPDGKKKRKYKNPVREMEKKEAERIQREKEKEKLELLAKNS